MISKEALQDLIAEFVGNALVYFAAGGIYIVLTMFTARLELPAILTIAVAGLLLYLLSRIAEAFKLAMGITGIDTSIGKITVTVRSGDEALTVEYEPIDPFTLTADTIAQHMKSAVEMFREQS